MAKIANFNPQQVIKNPFARVLIFLIALSSIAYIDISAGRVMFDARSFYPFLALLIVPASLFLKIGWEMVSVLRRSCVPIGIFVCSLNLLSAVSGGVAPADMLEINRLLYSPLALSLALSFLLSLIEPKQLNHFKLSRFQILAILLLQSLTSLIGLLIVSSGQDLSLSILLNDKSLLLIFVVMLICVSHPKLSENTWIQNLHLASLATVLLCAILGICLYTSAVATQDATALGGYIIVPIIGFFYGSSLAILTTTTGEPLFGSNNRDQFFDWHMVEAYAFYVLIIWPPLSITEIL